MAKRATDAKQPEPKRVVVCLAWNTLEGLLPIDPTSWSSVTEPLLKNVWTQRLRWYETLLLVANRLNLEYPGLKDVIVAHLIPRFIKPSLKCNAKFIAGALPQYRKAVVSARALKTRPLEIQAEAAFEADDGLSELANAVGLAREREMRDAARIAHVASLATRSFETWIDDPDPFDISTLVEAQTAKAKRNAEREARRDVPREHRIYIFVRP